MERSNTAKYYKLLILIGFLVLIRGFAAFPSLVEQYYSTFVYPYISGFFRYALGWLPFSVGDLLYPAAVIYLLVKTVFLFRQKTLRNWSAVLPQFFTIILFLYTWFLTAWGLNYYRTGIAQQVGIEARPYSRDDLQKLVNALAVKLNQYAAEIDTSVRMKYMNTNTLKRSAQVVFDRSRNDFPFFNYHPASVKPSLFSPVSHLIGYTGYINPFTSEAHLNTEVPVFLRPFIVTHEIAHQLGYGKEDEASFVGYLACRRSGNNTFLYSAYFELYRTAAAELAAGDKEMLGRMRQQLHEQVLRDEKELEAFFRRFKNPVERFISVFYNNYLKMNNQPDGTRTYNYVISLVMAYINKNGIEAL